MNIALKYSFGEPSLGVAMVVLGAGVNFVGSIEVSDSGGWRFRSPCVKFVSLLRVSLCSVSKSLLLCTDILNKAVCVLG